MTESHAAGAAASIEAARLAKALDGHQLPGGNYAAHCPAHEDRTASLSISTGDDGKTLVCCHAGCSQQAVIEALKARGLWVSSQGRRIDVTYDYRDKDGSVVFQVVRYLPKDFRQRRPDGAGGWIWNIKGIKEPPIYRLPEVLAAIREGKPILVVEGEKDVESLAKLGFVATCNHGGAGKWRDHHSQQLEGARVIYAVPDGDEAGEKHLNTVAASLARHGIEAREVRLPHGKDAAEWIGAGGTAEDLNALLDKGKPHKAKPTASTGHAESGAVTSDYQSFPLTDTGNAERLVHRFGRGLRYCYEWGKWLVWTGAHWEIDSGAKVQTCAKNTVRLMYAEAAETLDDTARKALATHARRSEAAAKRSAMIQLAQCEPGIPVKPAELDTDTWLLNCANGTVDLRTGQLRAHRQDDLITKQVPVSFDPAADCPVWKRFLDRIFDGKEDLIRFVQKAFGYALTGNISEQCFFILHGGGENGKSTLLGVLLDLLGDQYAQQAPPELLMVKGRTHPTELADLRGRRAVVSVETDEGRRLAENLVKQMTGGDRMRARFMRQDFFEFKPTHKLLLATNHKPQIRGTDHAIWRRVRLIPFNVTIPKPEQDKCLDEKLRAEMPGILAWCVEGCSAWQREGLEPPEEVVAATNGYRAEMDVLAAFLDERCEINPDPRKAQLFRETAKALYQAYVQWCDENGERPETQRSFGMRLTERGLTRVRHGTAHMWKGIRLRAAVSDPLVTQVTHCDPDSDINTRKNKFREINAKSGSLGSLGSLTDEPDSEVF